MLLAAAATVSTAATAATATAASGAAATAAAATAASGAAATAATAATAAATTAASGAAAAAPPPRLVHAAHEFEAQMMQELLKPLTSGAGLDGEEDGGSDSGSNGALAEFASESLGRALSEHGGFGIATSIIRELSPKGNKTVTSRVTGNLHGNTVISPHQ